MSSDIAFRVQVSKNIGIGHIKRLILLKHKLKINPIWIISGNKEIIEKVFKNKKKFYFIKRFSQELKLIQIIKKKGIKKVVFDIANNSNIKIDQNIKLINLYKDNHLKTISFDNPRQKLVSDISIIPYDYNLGIKKNKKTKIFIGSKYFFNRKNFIENNVPIKINKILITIGGSDYRNIGLKLLKLFKYSNFKIRLLVGLNNKFEFNNQNHKIIKMEDNIDKHLKWCDIIICGEGITKYEAVYQNKPVIMIHQFDVRSHLIKQFLSQKTCLSLGLYNNKIEKSYKESINRYIYDKEIQSKHIKAQKKIFNDPLIIKKQKILLREIIKL
jgi:spore coat polysaccharide biosynthesis predicted glycosyltransferase SpsG